jgi:hypothetical protein
LFANKSARRALDIGAPAFQAGAVVYERQVLSKFFHRLRQLRLERDDFCRRDQFCFFAAGR